MGEDQLSEVDLFACELQRPGLLVFFFVFFFVMFFSSFHTDFPFQPAVQMAARGGGEGALGDMSSDTYIIGITVLGIASLFANISGFFNP